MEEWTALLTRKSQVWISESFLVECDSSIVAKERFRAVLQYCKSEIRNVNFAILKTQLCVKK